MASSSFVKASSDGAPLFSFGIIADVQYADAADGSDFAKTVVRRYRQSLRLLRGAVTSWNRRKHSPISFIAQLGDLVDGCNAGRGESVPAMDAVLNELGRSKCKEIYHLIGNHELYNFDRSTLDKLLNTSRDGKSYYAFHPVPGWKFLVLDAYDISTAGPAGGDPEEAYAMLAENNPNDLRREGVNWRDGLSGLQCRWMPYNGAVGGGQLQWLEEELAGADRQGERVVILSHVGLAPRSQNESCLIWNYEKVLSVCHASPSLCLVLAGHAHRGGYIEDEHGVHHVTVQSPLECEETETAFATAHVYADRIELEGEGRVPSRVLPLRSRIKLPAVTKGPDTEGESARGVEQLTLSDSDNLKSTPPSG